MEIFFLTIIFYFWIGSIVALLLTYLSLLLVDLIDPKEKHIGKLGTKLVYIFLCLYAIPFLCGLLFIINNLNKTS